MPYHDKHTAMCLSAESRRSMAVAAETEVDGVPVQRFVKSLPLGHYIHPVHEWELDITADVANRWSATFAKMRKAGVPVKFTKDHGQTSDDVLGDVVDMWVDGDDIVYTLEARGKDAIELCHRVKHISPEIEEDKVDGKGISYGEAITAVSITPDPVVPNQRPFVKVAASAAKVPVLCFSTALSQENDTMLDLEKLAEVIGHEGDPLTDDTALEAITGAFGKTTEHGESLKRLLDETKGKVDSLTAKIKELEAANSEDELDSELANERAKRIEQRVEASITSGCVAPALKDELTKLLLGTPDARPTLMLSAKAVGGGDCLADRILDVLAKNGTRVVPGAKTGVQMFSRNTPGGEDDGHDPKVTEKMSAMARGERV